MNSVAGGCNRRQRQRVPPPTTDKAATLPYLEAWQAQLASEATEAQASAAATEAAQAVTAQGPGTALQQEREEEEARVRWAERMQAHLQGVEAAGEVRAADGSHPPAL